MTRFALPLALIVGLVLAAPLPAATGLGPAAALAKNRPKPKTVVVKDPEAVIRSIYSQYTKEAGPAEAEQETFSPDLLQLWFDAQSAGNGTNEVSVDFDVFIDAQDVDVVTNVATKFTPEGVDKGTIDAAFTVLGDKKTVHYDMVKTGQGWKIDNISWGPGR